MRSRYSARSSAVSNSWAALRISEKWAGNCGEFMRAILPETWDKPCPTPDKVAHKFLTSLP